MINTSVVLTCEIKQFTMVSPDHLLIFKYDDDCVFSYCTGIIATTITSNFHMRDSALYNIISTVVSAVIKARGCCARAKAYAKAAAWA